MSDAKTESPEKIAKCAEVGRNARRRHDEVALHFAEVFNARLVERRESPVPSKKTSRLKWWARGYEPIRVSRP